MNWDEILIQAIRDKNIQRVKDAIEGGANLNGHSGIWEDTPLTIAAYTDAPLEIFELLVRHGANVNLARRGGYTPLIQSVHFCTDIRIPVFLLDKGADLTARDTMDEGGDDSMLSAASSPLNGTSILNLLFAAGANLETRDTIGNTPLLLAACNGYFDKVKWFVENGADIHAINDNGYGLLFCAVLSGDTTILSYCLDILGVKDINSVDSSDNEKNTPLMAALRGGHFDLASYLVSMGIDVNKGNPEGDEPLAMAARYFCNGSEEKLQKKLDCMKQLLDTGASVLPKRINLDMPNMTGGMCTNLPLIETLEPEVIRLLIKYGADINYQDDNGNTAAIIAAGEGLHEKLSFLVSMGADIEICNSAGNTPLLEACLANKTYYSYGEASPESMLECVSVLLKAGANREVKNNLGNTAFLNALSSPQENSDIIKLLIDNKADIHAKNAKRQGSLIVSLDADSALQNFSFVKDNFLFTPEDINTHDTDGNPPLVHAISSGNQSAVRFFLDNGADVHWKNKKGENLLFLAIQNKSRVRDTTRRNIVSMLLDSGVNPTDVSSSSDDAFVYAAQKECSDIFAVMLAKNGGYNGLAQKMFNVFMAANVNTENHVSEDSRTQRDIILGLSMFMSGDAIDTDAEIKNKRLSDQWTQKVLKFVLDGCSYDNTWELVYEETESNEYDDRIGGLPPSGRGAEFLDFITSHADSISFNQPPLKGIWTSLHCMEQMVRIMNDALDTRPESVFRFLKKTKGLDMESWLKDGVSGAETLVARMASLTRSGAPSQCGRKDKESLLHNGDGNISF